MKNIVLFLIMALLTGPVLAHEDQIDACERQASHFGSGKGADYISSSCLELIEKISRKNSNKKNPDQTLQVFGHRNIVFLIKNVNGKLKRHVIAGSSTKLEDVVAVALDEVNKE